MTSCSVRIHSRKACRHGPGFIISNHEGREFRGRQYTALTLTISPSIHDFVEIPEASWIEAGTPDDSRIVPWGVQSLDSEDIEFWRGRLDRTVVDEAVAGGNYVRLGITDTLSNQINYTIL